MAERAIPIDIEGLDWDTGAPQPIVISSEWRTFIVFYGQGGPERDEVVVSAEFVGCVAIKSGFPNEDVLHGHSLWGHGLSFYRVHEVRDSAWIAELAAIESVHYLSPAVPFAKARHFVLTFHDSTVEAVASGPRVPSDTPDTSRSGSSSDRSTGYIAADRSQVPGAPCRTPHV